MVNKVAGDPYGIGYCSSAMADPNKVMILGVVENGVSSLYPPNTGNNVDSVGWRIRIKIDHIIIIIQPADECRELYAVPTGNAATVSDNTRFADSMLSPSSSFVTTSLQAGPLFQASYLAH